MTSGLDLEDSVGVVSLWSIFEIPIFNFVKS